MTLTAYQKQFSIHVVGEATGKTYTGDFVVQVVLGSRHHFLTDQLYRKYLGGDPTHADSDVKFRAKVLSEINGAIVQAPLFWREEGDGVDLLDDNVLSEVYSGLLKKVEEFENERQEKTKAAADKLKATVEKAAAKTDSAKE
ncbi:hypothetical protein [Myxococcus phage Mx1]|nr:hypothetical protein [Myxococcus phage Mx1]